MKILQLGKYYYPHMGGIETHLYLLSTGLSEAGNDVTVVVSNDGMSFVKDKISGIEVYRYPKLFEILNAPISPFQLAFSSKKFDIVHVHLPNPIASLHALMTNGNLIVTYHSDIIKFGVLGKLLNSIYTNLILHPLLKKAKKVLVTSPNYLFGSGILEKYRDKVVVVPYSIDLGLFKPNKNNRKILNSLNKKYKNKKVILFVGRLIPYKGLEYLIHAIPSVLNKFNDVKLLIVGDGPLKQELVALVDELGISDFVDFVGDIHNENLPPYYCLCDIFVLPSTYKAEAFGIVQLEAMACGKPIVSTNVQGSGITFVNKENETGLIVEPGNSNELAGAIIKLLKSKNLQRRLGRNGKLRVKHYFSKSIMVKNILNVYDSILKRQREF